MKELLIGCGRNKQKKIKIKNEDSTEWNNVTTLDINPDNEPDVLWDLNNLPYPFEDNSFDEIHAYEVLEHLGSLGDYRSFLSQFQELWRILKPEGFLCGSSPALTSPWLFGDPGHTRVISPESLVYLSQDAYKQIDAGSPMTDYRNIYKGDLLLVGSNIHKINDDGTALFIFILKAIK